MLKIENVSKIYKKGDVKALQDINIDIKKGEFVALLGQNGAGKSTLINVLVGNVLKDSGNVLIGDYNLDENELETKNIIGVVPQEVAFDFTFTVMEILKAQSGYFGIKNNQNEIETLLKKLSLFDKKDVKARALSGGMKRRLMIAKALIHKPQLLILDEPTAGVDIELRHSLYVFLNELHQSGITIILTTHYLEEAEELCERIIVINKGKVVADDTKDSLMNKFTKKLKIEFYFDEDQKISRFIFLSDYSPEISNKNILKLKVEKNELADVFQSLKENKIDYKNFMIQQQKLEDVFLKIVNN